MKRRTESQARLVIRERLEARRGEVEEAVLTRISAIADPTIDTVDPLCAEGLRVSVAVALDYGLEAITHGEERHPPPPPLLAQARMAARHGIGLDVVLRRYLAGHALFDDFLIDIAQECGVEGTVLKRLLRGQASIADRVLATVSEEYMRENEDLMGLSDRGRLERVERLLRGEPVDTTEFTYDFEAHHIGAIAIGHVAGEAIAKLAASLDRLLLMVRKDETTVWAWLGGRRTIDSGEIADLLAAEWPARVPLAIGEPASGLNGWRLSHRQALAALPIAQRSATPFTRYADVALLASIRQDNLLITSLHQLYLAPLERGRDGATLRRTLRAYFATGRNISSAAAELKVSRQTVNRRLALAERHLGQSLASCASEIEAALRLVDVS